MFFIQNDFSNIYITILATKVFICDIVTTIVMMPKIYPEAATGGVLWKKVFLENSQISQGNTLIFESFLLQAWGLQLYEKRNSNTGVFQRILWNF